MKKIEVNGTVLYYVVYCSAADYESNYETRFYTSTKLKPTWRFLWFKSQTTVEVPDNHIFSLYVDITDCEITKEWLRQSIEGEFNRYLEREKRCEEISRGEII